METERLATLGSISGMLVHDLKQPLMSLAVNAELLARARRVRADASPGARARVDRRTGPRCSR